MLNGIPKREWFREQSLKFTRKIFDYKGYTHHATQDEPQYEIKSDKSDHIAAHKGKALTKIL